MSAITTKFVTDHKLTNEIGLEELSQYASEMRNLLTDDREKRRQTHNRLQKGYKFSKEQAFALIPDQRIGRYISQAPVMIPEAEENISQVFDQNGLDINNAPEGETIRETAQRII